MTTTCRAPWALPAVGILLSGVLASCAPAVSSSTRSNTGGGTDSAYDEVLAAHTRLVSAYESADVGAFLAELDPSPELLIFHPLREDRFDGHDEVRRGLGRMFEGLGEISWVEAHSSVVVEGKMAWLTSHFSLEASGAHLEMIGRSTEIWRYSKGRWRLVHGHWSQNPEEPARFVETPRER